MLQVSELYIYPIKSLAGIAVKQARVTTRGFEFDRRWLLVDENKRFLTQREFPQMALLQPSIEGDTLRVTHSKHKSSISMPLRPAQRQIREEVVIWDDTCAAQPEEGETAAWFSEMLGLNCRLVYMPDDSLRVTDQRYAPEDSITSFADAYPFLLIGQASLDELNNKLSAPLSMNRFRPNIVFTGGIPFAEDQYQHFTIGTTDFFGVKLCARCVVTTIDQQTAEKGKEPLRTLAGYRFKDNKILFGQNLVHKGEGLVTLGDELTVFKEHSDERFTV